MERFSDVFNTELRPLGLCVNKEKSRVCFSERIRQRIHWCPPDQVSVDGIIYMQVPYGRFEFVQKALRERVADVSLLCDAIVVLPAQYAFQLLSVCISRKGTYALRMVPPWHTNVYATSFDNHITTCVWKLLGETVGSTGPTESDRFKALCSLPVKRGGLGLTALSDIREAAWVASEMSVELRLTDFEVPRTMAQRRTDAIRVFDSTYEPAAVQPPRQFLQREFTEVVMARKYDDLLTSFDNTEQVAKKAFFCVAGFG